MDILNAFTIFTIENTSEKIDNVVGIIQMVEKFQMALLNLRPARCMGVYPKWKKTR